MEQAEIAVEPLEIGYANWDEALYARAAVGVQPVIEKSIKPSTTRVQLDGGDNASCEGDRETRRRDAVGQQLD